MQTSGALQCSFPAMFAHPRAYQTLQRKLAAPRLLQGSAFGVTCSTEQRRPPQPRRRPPPAAGYGPGPSPPTPQRAPPSMPPSDEVYLPRSLIMDKEVITRTSGKRLGYINQLFVDPARLEVVSVYLRQGMTSLGASNADHVMVSSLRQIGDVVLVHDESALLDPPADETYGYVRLVGSEVQTEDGTSLGKVRDFVFNPDNGLLVSIRYDALGLPSIPQSLLSCWTLGWQDIVAVGPTKTIVRRGAEMRAVKENDGWISEYVTALVNAVAGEEEEGAALGASEAYRSDPAYAAWYGLHAAEYEQYYGQRLPKPVMSAGGPPPTQRPRQQEQQQVRRRRDAPSPRQQQQPMALPPPQSNSYKQALQMEDQQQRQRQYAGSGMPESARRISPVSMPRQEEGYPPQRPQQQQRASPPPPSTRVDAASRPGAQPARLPTDRRTEQGPRTAQSSSSGAAAVEPDAVIAGGYPRPAGAAPRYRQSAEYNNTPTSPPRQENSSSIPPPTSGGF